MRYSVHRVDSVERVNEAGPSAAASRSRSRTLDYGRGRTRSRSREYGRTRIREYDRSRSRDYGRSRSRSRRRSRSRDYGRGRSRSTSLDYGRRISRRSSSRDYGSRYRSPTPRPRARNRSSSLDYSTSISRSLDFGGGRSRSSSLDSRSPPRSPFRSPSLARAVSPDYYTTLAESWNISETPISGTLKDPQLLDCPICCLPLNPPVYQCTNGHVSCESCCTKMSNECGTCHLPIGRDNNRNRAIEKILESFGIACKNAQHGCTASVTYNTKLDHEKTCRYGPCYCPFLDCTYAGLPECVYTHFASQHSTYSEKFRFHRYIKTSLEKDQKHIFLQEENAEMVFVISRSIEDYGSIVNVICIAPTSSEKQFSYVITPSHKVTESKMRIEFVAENRPQWNQQAPPTKTKHVIVPNYCLTSSGRLDLKLVIFDD